MSNTHSLPEQSSSTFERLTGRKVGRWLILIGLFVILLVPLVKGWRLYRLARAFQAHQTQAEQLLASGPTAVDPDAAEELVLAVRRDYLALQNEVEPLLFLTPYLGWLPKVGPLMPEAPTLLAMGDAGTELAVHLITGFKPALTIIQDDSLGEERLPALTQLLADARPQLADAAVSFDNLVAARQQLGDTSRFPHSAQTLLDTFDHYTPLAQQGFQVAPVLPLMLGQDRPRQYLIIAQNEEELRPTGGFISGVGLLTVEQGRILALEFEDAYRVDNLDNLAAYDWPPEPLQKFMGSDYFLFRDSNFWPDFPTSAAHMMRLYTKGTGVVPDGVIAIDQRFLELLVVALEPVEVPELELTLNRHNVREALRGSWEAGTEDQQWFASRKSFMGPMANSILQKVTQNPAALNPLELADALQTALQNRHLQIYVTDPAVNQPLTQVGWTGQLRPQPQQDSLLIVDANLGFNKVNAVVDKTVTYEVSLTETAAPQATLTTTYHNTSTGQRSCREIIPRYSAEEALSYEELLDVCYRNYLRVYTPPGTTLLTASEHPVPATQMLDNTAWDGQAQTLTETAAWQTFANFMVIPQQQTATAHFVYQLPAGIIQEQADGTKQYVLTVYKQAGISPYPLTVHIQLPAEATLTTTQPAPTAVDNNLLSFKTSLEQDTTFIISYRDNTK